LIVIGVAALILAIAAGALAAAGNTTVEEMVFATGVESRMPLGVAEAFDASTPRVVCWTRIAAESPPVTVRHVWSRDGKNLVEVPLTVNYPSGRYWSIKNVAPGDWRVDVVNEKGEVLESKAFVVKP
jgi:hypothetical protein